MARKRGGTVAQSRLLADRDWHRLLGYDIVPRANGKAKARHIGERCGGVAVGLPACYRSRCPAVTYSGDPKLDSQNKMAGKA